MRIVRHRRYDWKRVVSPPWPCRYYAETAAEWGQGHVRPDLRRSEPAELWIEPQPNRPPLYRLVLQGREDRDVLESGLLLGEALNLADTL